MTQDHLNKDHLNVDDIVKTIVQSSGTSFFWAMRLLPEARRTAIYAVYAFCRIVDDIADELGSKDEKHHGLNQWRDYITMLYSAQIDDHHIQKQAEINEADKAVLSVLRKAIQDYNLEQADFIAIIDGMQMDVDGPIIAPGMTQLELYCDRVACAVGRLCVPIFGQADEKGRAVANNLGLALQLTNIIRDVEDDARIGRLYLPQELLDKAGITNPEPQELVNHPDLPVICQKLGLRAQQAYDAAALAIAQCDPKAMKAPIIMMQVYYLNLKRLRKLGWDPRALAQINPINRQYYRIEKLITALRYGGLG